MKAKETSKKSAAKTLVVNPKDTVKALLTVLPARAQDVIRQRYGLGKSSERATLEAIGDVYGITRERVRQIENFALKTIRKSPAYTAAQYAFDGLEEALVNYGGIVHEGKFLAHLSADKGVQNAAHFLLVLGDRFEKLREDDEFHHRWTVDKKLGDKVHTALRKLCSGVKEADLIKEEILISQFLKDVKDIVRDSDNPELARRWLELSKQLSKNPLGEWGLSKSPNVKLRGMRDYAYLVIRNNEEPMHFSKVTEKIRELFSKRAHTATCHNELIKDDRFILVGRGLYALREWGYREGIVRDIIEEILKQRGPLMREDIVSGVLKERMVKHNTIIVNLQNSHFFKRLTDGRYALV